MTLILNNQIHWECPNCDTQDVCSVKPGESRMHTCPGLGGLTAPMVPAGTKCKAEATVWEDYVRHDEAVRHNGDGVPISAVKVTREDGEDVAVFPASAIVRMEF